VQIAVLKLTDQAKLFNSACQELHEEDMTNQKFREVFRQRFKDIHTDQYHYMKLQTSRKGRNEDTQVFADRCPALSQNIMCRVSDPLAQQIHRENTKRILLAIFVTGVLGVPRKSVRLTRQSPNQANCERDSPSRSADTRTNSRTCKHVHSAGNTSTSETTSNSQTKAALK